MPCIALHPLRTTTPTTPRQNQSDVFGPPSLSSLHQYVLASHSQPPALSSTTPPQCRWAPAHSHTHAYTWICVCVCVYSMKNTTCSWDVHRRRRRKWWSSMSRAVCSRIHHRNNVIARRPPEARAHNQAGHICTV